MVWARYHREDRRNEWEYGASGDVFRRLAVRFHERKRKIAKLTMAQVQNIDKELGEMTDEELLEVVNGQRKLRMTGPAEKKKTTTRKPKKTQEERVADQMKDFDALPLEEKIKLFEKLGGSLD
jgi:hypothetical protein